MTPISKKSIGIVSKLTRTLELWKSPQFSRKSMLHDVTNRTSVTFYSYRLRKRVKFLKMIKEVIESELREQNWIKIESRFYQDAFAIIHEIFSQVQAFIKWALGID